MTVFSKVANCWLARHLILRLKMSTDSNSKTVMEKRKVELKHLKRKRLAQEGNSSVSLIPSNIHLQVIQNGSPGYGKCLYLFSNFTRYLFNCPEGTQRLCNEYGAKISRLEHVFFTRASWENVGGISGFTLTANETGVSSIGIYGPPGPKRIFEATRYFDENVHVKNNEFVSLVDRSVENCRQFEDEAIKVDMVLLENAENPQPKKPSNDGFWDIAVAFVVETKPKRGKMILQQCLDIGVPVGPMLGQLQAGQSVTLEDGRLITPAMVQENPEPPPIFAVIECPNENFIDSLLESDIFNQLKSNDRFVLMVHLSSQKVFESEKYQKFLSGFENLPNLKNLIMNETSTAINHSAEAFRNQLKLNLVDEKIFPLLDGLGIVKEKGYDSVLEPDANFEKKFVRAEPLLKFVLRPLTGFERDRSFQTDQLLTISEATDAFDFENEKKKFENLSQNFRKTNICEKFGEKNENENLREFPEVIFFGTASAIPQKNRNVSSFLINSSPESAILCDCGESTFLQMIQMFGAEKTDAILRRIKMIFISHLHADHHLGLFSIFLQRIRAFENSGIPYEPCFILASALLYNFHKTYETVLGVNLREAFVRIGTKVGSDFEAKCKPLRETLKLRDLKIVPVLHPQMAYGILFTLENGEKIVYSGDTMPCDELINVGKNCDLLIHEATMEDELM